MIVLIVVALQFPQVQNYVAHKGASYLSDTLDTEVRIGGFTTDWRNAIVLKDVYVEDQQQDTLWYSQRLGIDIMLWSLLQGEVNIGRISLEHATANLHIRPDSSSNFGFIMEAFATDTTVAQPVDTTSSALAINLDVINLEDVHVNFRDEPGGNWIKGHVGHLLTTMEELDLDAQRYLVDEVELENTAFSYTQTKLPPPDTTESEPLEMEFGINRVALDNVKLNYNSQPAEQSIALNIGQSELEAQKIDLINARIDLDKFALHNTDVIYKQDKYKPTDSLAVNPQKTVQELDSAVEQASGEPANWIVTLDALDVSDLDVKFDNFNAPAQPQGMDYDHLLFRNIAVDANDIYYSLNRTTVDLNQLKLQEKSGFQVKNFQAAITFDSTHTELANLDLVTGNSHLQRHLAVGYPSLDAVAENPEQLTLDLDIQNSVIGMQDALYFAPYLAENPSFKSIAKANLQVDGQVEGSLENLHVRQLNMSGLQGTEIAVTGDIRNATDPNKLYMDLRINQLATTRTDIRALTPPGTLPTNIRIPAQLSMTGTYKGSLTAFDANADLRSSYGNMKAVVNMDPGPAGSEPFTASISTNRFNLGQLFTDSLGVGIIALNATAKGTGLTPETMRAQVKADIKTLEYNNYTYNNIDVNANINRNLYTVAATAEDKNLDFDLKGDFNLRNSDQPSYTFDLDLDEANLMALNFYPEQLSVTGNMTGSFTGMEPSTISGTLEAEDLVITLNENVYPLDSLALTLQQNGEGAAILLQSELLNADMQFQNTLATLPIALQKHFSDYFDLQPDPPYPAETNLEDFKVQLQLKDTKLLTAFVPGLEKLAAANPITATYNGETQALQLDGTINTITYTGYTLKDLALQVRGDENALNYSINLEQLISPSLKVDNVSFTGAARDNDMTIKLAVAGNGEHEQFVIGGLLNSLGPGYRFSFNPDQLVINGDRWTVPAENYLQYDTNLLYANNIQLQHDNSYIALNSTGPLGPNAPLNVQFSNFKIGYLLETFQREDSLAAGTINGTATINNLMAGTMSFTSDLSVTKFAFQGVPVGDIALQASSQGLNRYNVDASLTSNGNQLLVDGFYESQPNASLLNFDVNVANLNMASFQGFTAGMVKDMGGSASGRLHITGTLDDPAILGQLNFNQAQFNVAMLDALYRLEDERLVFNEQGINFPDFTLTDSLGNDLVVNGNILTKDYVDYRFDLTASTDKFLAMNSTAADNDLYYGTVLMAADASITGDLARPELKINVRVLDGSAFTAVVPADEVGAAEREGVVEFVNLNPSLTAIIDGQQEADTAQTGFVGADIEVEVTVTDATPITIVIDPTTGDNLVVRGTADPLFVGITPSGQINMTGRYVITDGKYSMDFYNLASRELDIKEGSYIAWTGDPLQADLQITAVYTVETAPLELVATQIETQDPALRNQVPFQVFVIVEGEIMKPEISFNIEIPEEKRGQVPAVVTTSLGNLRQDESEMNKQVFSLLVLGRFMAPDPLASSGGGFAASARNSLSQIMTDQLNQLTNKYAGGLGLELGVNSYEDYSSGSAQGRTDLNVALRQQFLDDRLTVRIGSDIGLEGQGEANKAAGGFGGDISIEYSITKDGRLRVQGFQRNEYAGILEATDVRTTGVSLIYVRDYNNFSDLFRSLEARMAKEKQKRIEAAELRSQE
ncbi:translocation/assembly module TamB domain-containing protein [Pontibacter sp. 172403-2]|uniref:translocation/assembly module TamB domain-containing protein n=1 Tax=Pontibacter rufus TaxID=2791028 RepID=UPI0018AF9C68|nr:translocation/assembly module TamB [Pontibacter sp. 172403-2]MBF9253692.1 translocation/assembly module TamB domain-containing protein [Pontibacter sp. 172403-2]